MKSTSQKNEMTLDVKRKRRGEPVPFAGMASLSNFQIKNSKLKNGFLKSLVKEKNFATFERFMLETFEASGNNKIAKHFPAYAKNVVVSFLVFNGSTRH